MFHHFHGGAHAPGQGSISADDLNRMLDFLGTENIVTPDAWLRGIAAGTLRPGQLCLTFDDGLKCQYDIAAPILAKRGLTAFFFVPSAPLESGTLPLEIYRYVRGTCFASMDAFYEAFDREIEASPYASAVAEGLKEFNPRSYLSAFDFYTDGDRRFRFIRDKILGSERYATIMDAVVRACAARGLVDVTTLPSLLWMSRDDVKNLRAQGHVIGLHSHTHPTDMASLPAAQQEDEYRRNRACLSSLLGEEIVCMSHPCNSYGSGTLELLQGMGIRCGFRSMMHGGGGSALELPRQDHAHVFAMMHAV